MEASGFWDCTFLTASPEFVCDSNYISRGIEIERLDLQKELGIEDYCATDFDSLAHLILISILTTIHGRVC